MVILSLDGNRHTMDKQLDRLRALIDELADRTGLLQKNIQLEEKLTIYRAQLLTLRNIIDVAGYAVPYYEFTGTVKDIDVKGEQVILIVFDGPKRTRFIMGDNRCPADLQEGCTVRIQADIIPITISWAHWPGGFIQGSSVRNIEIVNLR